MHLCIFEDPRVENFQPLTHLNPIFELLSGCFTILSKHINYFSPKSVSLFVRPYLEPVAKELHPYYNINQHPDSTVLFVNGRVLPDKNFANRLNNAKEQECIYYCGNQLVAAILKPETSAKILKFDKNGYWTFVETSSIRTSELSCNLIDYPWDLIYSNPSEIVNDFHFAKKNAPKRNTTSISIYPGAHLLNKKNMRIGKGCIIKPGVVLDAEQGPIILGNNVTIMPNAVIEGPVFIGDHATIKIGAKIYPGTSIGAYCKIGGEVTRSVFSSYSNKAHDGFVGDSYLGNWVNLGADTNTSNLKNTYGTVTVQLNGHPIDSGKQFLGLIMGDHAKSGINVMFNTGSVVGTSCNVYGSGLPPKYLPSFTWGSNEQFSNYEFEKSLEVARRMMERRGITLTTAYKAMMQHVYNQTHRERKKWLKK